MKIKSLRTATAALSIGLIAGCVTAPPADQPAIPPIVDKVPAAPPIAPPALLAPVLKPTTFAAIPGWMQDDQRETWPAFLASCDALLARPGWKEPCAIARDVKAADLQAVRRFFEAFFVPHQVINADATTTGLVTGYYEPLLRGARKPGGPFKTPLHRVPDDMLLIDMSGLYPNLKTMRLRGRLAGGKILPYYSRAELMESASLAGKELVWVDDPVDAFFLQVQGSGRVALADTGETIRVAYADQNGHPYKSIGRHLVDMGAMTLDQASAQSIKAWIAANPNRLREVLNANPSYVFFNEEKITDPRKGPKGALGAPLTPQRSIAVDPQVIPLGIPVFLSTTHPNSKAALQRLVMAQDTGGAIKGAVRADFFWGFGAEAGEKAGKMKQPGAMWAMLPKTVSPLR